MSRHTRYELRRKCAKCNITATEDTNLSFHRFPLPGRHTLLKARVWAEYCYPTGEWSTEKPLRDLHSQHKMLCSKHFDDSSFTSSARIRLNNYAIPIGTQYLLIKFRQEQCATASGSEQDTNISVEKSQEIKTITETLPTSKSPLLKPIEDLPVQDTPEITQELPTCSTTVENTDICDDDDDAVDDSDTLVESNVCRVCLAMDVKMYDLNDIELREMFQNITGIAVTANNHPILERLCWECAGRLKAAAAFRSKALLSDALLQKITSTGEQILKNDITLIKNSEDYLNTAATLTVVEAFHIVDIDPENDGIPSLSENNDTKIVQNTVRPDSLKPKKISIIAEDNNQMDIEGESMIEVPINTEMEYDQFDHICPITGEKSSNVFLETNPVFSSNIPLKEDTTNSANSSALPSCSQDKPKYPILGYLLKTPGECEYKIKKPVINITKRDLITKIVSKNSKELISAKSKNINVKIGGISKKTLNLKLLKNTQVNANTPTDEESLSLENLEV